MDIFKFLDPDPHENLGGSETLLKTAREKLQNHALYIHDEISCQFENCCGEEPMEPNLFSGLKP